MKMAEGIISTHLIQKIDTQPFDSPSAIAIASAFTSYEFKVVDIHHHISIWTGHEYGREPWECACLYLDNYTMYIRALAKRWWLLFNLGDALGRYEEFWHVADRLEQSPYPIVSGTVGELDLRKAFQEEYGREPTVIEWQAIEEVISANEQGGDRNAV